MSKKDVSDLTIKMLQQHERTRNSDSDLQIGVLYMIGFQMTEQQRELFRSVSMESIRRTRQKLQKEGKYLPTDPAVARRRKVKADNVSQNIGQAGPERAHQLIIE